VTRTRTPIIWIDWVSSLRSRTLAQRLGIDLHAIRVGGPRVWRYLSSIVQTLAAIRNARPEIVVATNPSLVLGFLLLALRKWYDFVLVSDAHYVGVKALRGRWIWQKVLDLHNSKADLVIVTTENHERHLALRGCRTYVCPDPLPQVTAQGSAAVAVPPKSVFLVCSFFEDEPYETAFAAFSRLQERGYTLFVSGNYKKVHIDPRKLPWVRFLGFVPDAEYYANLRACSVILDLTTLEDCLVCGAYEALAARKPLVVSNTQALGNYFGGAAVLTDNTAEAIVENVEQAFAERDALARKAAAWASANELYMSERIATLSAQLRSLRVQATEGSHSRPTV
jgi:glycosyltransferase involved in cell wall biosynthesis